MSGSAPQHESGLTRLAVRRPVTTLMAACMLVLLGGIALSRLAVDLMPDVSFPTLSIVTVYQGAGPEEVETLISRPIEQAVSSVPGVDRIFSESMEGSSTVRVRFTWGTNLDVAISDIRQQLDRIRRLLPDDIDPPYVRKYDIADQPILLMGVQSELSGVELTSLADRVIIPRLEQVDGVARVSLRGAEIREIQVQLDRAQMEARRVGVNDVIAALRKSNVTQPAGDFERGDTRILVRNRGEYRQLEEIRQTVVVNRAGAVVRVADIAEVVDGLEDRTEVTRVNGQPALMAYVFKQSGANTVAVSDNVHNAVARLNEELRDAELIVRQDRSDFIRQAISNIQVGGLLGMGLATIVLIIFLQSLRSTLIIGVAMPLSVIATFTLIYFQGFTLNIVSFGGLALGIGLLVDNSIVVLESIFRYRERGHDSITAAVEGTREVAGAITASTLTTLIVFLPLIFVQGITGVLLHQLAWVVSFSLCCSLLVSLTITPVMAAYWLPRFAPGRHAQHESAPVKGLLPKMFDRIHAVNKTLLGWSEQAYQRVLRLCLKQGFLVGTALCVLLAFSFGMYPLIRTEFLPETDEGVVSVTLYMAPGITLDRLVQQALIAEERILNHTPERISLAGFIGGAAEDADRWNRIHYRIVLQPRHKRTASSEDIRKRLERELTGISGCRISVRVSQEQLLARAISRMGEGRLAVYIRGHDLGIMQQLSNQTMEIMNDISGYVNVELAQSDARPELGTFIDRTKASQLDVSVEDVSQTLETTLRGTQATIFRQDGDEIPLMVRFREDDRRSARHLEQVSVTSAYGKQIPLKNLLRFESGQAPVAIQRMDQQRTMVITADLSDRELGGAVQELNDRLRALALPRGYTISIGGDWEEQQKGFLDLQIGFALALLMMYMVMASQFESLRDPLLIIATVPLAGIGVILVFTQFNTTLNVQSFIGLIVLAGIVVNNAIVVVDYVRQLRLQQPEASVTQLVEQACVRRFRPIVMTTLTTVLAMLPVALGWGDGGELQAPMARVVVGGLISGTLTTLIGIPLLYVAVSQYAWSQAKPGTASRSEASPGSPAPHRPATGNSSPEIPVLTTPANP